MRARRTAGDCCPPHRMPDKSLPPPADVLRAWGLEDAPAAPLGSGLINRTWLVNRGQDYQVLQQVNRIFPPAVNDDIAAVTRHLRAKGMVAPELLPTQDGKLWLERDGEVWRLQTYVDGVGHDCLATPDQARQAGLLLARFHRALDDLGHTFHNPRPGVHDTRRHLAVLRQALEEHAGHPGYLAVQPLADAILVIAGGLPALPVTPDRIVHGDPKLNNILFDPRTGQALCLIDLDTLARMPLPLELGDAFRSWCNPAGEDSQSAAFSLELFAGAVAGYADGTRGWVSAAERDAIVPATLTIYVELAARFCADALNESYFGWDAARFPSRSAHNQVRAASQLKAARSLAGQRDAAEALVRAAFSRR